MLVIVPCGGQKRAGGLHRADTLYTGSYFKQALAAARALAPDSHIRVLSGKHGLLRLSDLVLSYEQRIDRPGAVPSVAVRRQAADQGLLDEPNVVALCGTAYAAIVLAVWPRAAFPLAKVGGMGHQLAALKKIRTSAGPMLFA